MGDGTITLRSFGYAPDQGLTLRNAEYARRIVYHNDWSRLRLGFLFSLAHDPVSRGLALANATLFFGLGTSSSNISDYSTQNFVGISLVGAAAPNSARGLTYNAGTLGNDYYTMANVGQGFTKYGTNYAVTSNNAAGFNFVLDRAPTLVFSENRRGAVVLEIIRPIGGGGNATMSAYCTATTQVAQDFRPDILMNALDMTGTPTLLGTAMTVLLNAVAINFSEEFGSLDMIRLFWGKHAPALNVWAIGGNLMLNTGYTSVGGAFEGFEGYSVGTYVPGSSALYDPAGTVLQAQGWGGTLAFQTAPGTCCTNVAPAGIFTGTKANYSGTSLGTPWDTFDTYSVGTATSSVLTAGTGWIAPGVTVGYANPSAQVGRSGTSAGFPADSFDDTDLGAVTSGVTISHGVGWASNGYIYP